MVTDKGSGLLPSNSSGTATAGGRAANGDGAGAAGWAGAAAGWAGAAAGGAAEAHPPLWGLLDVTAPLPPDPARLDPVDRRLLALLAADARASQRKLARALHMSPPAVGERIARLERLGVIRGYTVSIDWAALGYMTVYLAVTAVQGADQASILQALQALPEVEGIVVITGSMDMLARVRVRDHTHLRSMLLSRIWRIEGVQRTETFIGLAEMTAKTGYVADLLRAAEGEAAGDDPGIGAAAPVGDGPAPG